MDRTTQVLLFAAMLVVVALAAVHYPEQLNAVIWAVFAGALLNWVSAERK
jgi:uncharacterized MnhB-related membrane protein